jgi:Fe2+ or Zn2+ uptake regulation protein
MMKAQRLTKQKATILEILRSVESHPTAEWLYQEARKKIPGLSLGTVYRNLNQLRDNGEIMELDFGSNQSRYDGNAKNHYHFSCIECGKVYDMHISLIKAIEQRAKEEKRFMVSGYRLEYYGLCPSCQTTPETATPRYSMSMSGAM